MKLRGGKYKEGEQSSHMKLRGGKYKEGEQSSHMKLRGGKYKEGEQCSHLSRAQELCESRGGRPGLPVPNEPYGFCGRKATLQHHTSNGEETSTERERRGVWVGWWKW